MIGVWGHLAFPELQGTDSDQVLPMMLAEMAPEWLAASIMVGALAAFMSTMDSQLLALSSMLTRDLYVPYLRREATLAEQVWVGRVLVIVLAGLGLLVALRPPATIFALATEAFTGLAVLFPATVATMYWRRASARACVASIVVGELLLIGFHYDVIPAEWSLGFLPVTPIIAVTCLVLFVVSVVGGQPEAERMTS